MRLLIDADACPSKEMIAQMGRQYGLEVIFFCDIAHRIDIPGTVTVQTDQGRDAVDIKLMNAARAGDLVITQDYGLASMVLAKKTYVVTPTGMVMDLNNIDGLLHVRHLGMKARKAGQRTKGPAKRTPEDEQRLQDAIRRMIEHEQNREL